MVAPTTPRLEFVPELNLSRQYLFRAADALDTGNWIEAGTLLREAVRQQLYAECAWKNCLPKRAAQRRSPAALVDALKHAGHCGYCGYQWTKEIIDLCNKCAHCIPVKPNEIRCAIAIWHEAIDHDPCGEEPLRKSLKAVTKPWFFADDDDDDDAGEEWKKGVQV